MQHKKLSGLAIALCLSGCASDVEPRAAALGTGGTSMFATAGTTASGGAGGKVALGGSGGISTGGKGGTGGIIATAGVSGGGGMGTAGKGPAGSGGMGTGGVAPAMMIKTAKDPVVPAVAGECPMFASGTLDFMGLTGIQMQVGAKSEGTGTLVFYWHGTGSSSAESGQFAGGSDVVAQGGIVVAPSASGGQGGDCSGTGTFSIGDMDVADQIAACAVRDHGIDPHRIYTTGCSAGGLMAGCMATLRSNYIAAAAPNSGGIVGQMQLEGDHVPALMTMHGGSSDMVIVTFSQTSATLDMQFKAAGGFVMNCDHGGGHCAAPQDLQAAAWRFMQAHPFGVATEPYTMVPADFPTYCTIL